MIAICFQHPTPYFDDSYAVNSVNNGPYGDAIMTELIPSLEEHFRIIRKPYARILAGGVAFPVVPAQVAGHSFDLLGRSNKPAEVQVELGPAVEVRQVGQTAQEGTDQDVKVRHWREGLSVDQAGRR